ncbi:GTP-binding protein/GTPase [Theileria orientalis strain Shintoku]|uniref:GTP-binding protein/GTPase n=1 Tax=Theileria orientalis strain Shintoku TaxID=869250 RepID=J4DQ45_THEOR|nr:GTP-binding protein/GTPase [Theileria orientalis strain Shintoku]PVC49658.1 GTP-binding protein/GTPase [Theileria orientalis]BAM41814.1 GTP-binding protein/GTPase [Theileria orientalis strain Shintoku]|eukprot:XP_009692115.1 GTP-binding protein/GTPase [Theileria orientalis strain Shintoku]
MDMCLRAKTLYSGVGAKVASKVKRQFRLENDSQVKSLRKALKKFKRSEERRIIRAKMNALKSQHRANREPMEDNRNSKTKALNPFSKMALPKGSGSKSGTVNKNGTKPVRLGLSFDLASDVYGGAALMKDFDPHRRKIATLNFVGSYLHTTMLPSLGLPEICLVGRSNVGKSSFINSLMSYVKTKSRKCDMAFVSKTPGYTKSINVFEAVDNRGRGVLALVDLPGYGYTKVKNKETRKTMQSILKAYLKRRLELKLVLFLVDGSSEPQPEDYEVLQYFRENAFPHLFILTKMDKVTVSQTPGQMMTFRQYFDLKSPLPLPFSKFGGGDLGCVWKAIFDACTDSFDVSKLNLTDKFEAVKPDFSTFVGAQANVSLKDLKKMIFRNYDILPESVKSLDMDSMSRDQLLDVLKIAADRAFELQNRPLDLVQLKHKLTKR